MTRTEERDAIARAAAAVWGDDLGQVIVGREYASVFGVTGGRTLLHIEHPRAFEAAHKLLESLALPPAKEPIALELSGQASKIVLSIEPGMLQQAVGAPIPAPPAPPDDVPKLEGTK